MLIDYDYNSRGELTGLQRYSTMADQSNSYDPIGRLASTGWSGAGSADVSWSFTRNPASQILTETQSNDSYSWTGHVDLDRSYAANGLDQYTAAGGASFCHDANGNLTADGSSVYLYDVENRLVEKRAQTNSTCAALSYAGTLQASLRYDPLGRLYEESSPAAVTRMVYDGDALVAEYSSAGTLLRRYVHGPNAGTDDPLIWWEGAALRMLYADARGSIALVRDSAGATNALNSYDEYGIPAATNAGRFQYTGQIWLPAMGVFYYKARMYSPTLGRFMQTDPIGYEDQINLYAYVGNDPMNFSDPDGKNAVAIGGRLAAAGTAAAADGPLPIGDVIAVGILIYTGYEILTAESSEPPRSSPAPSSSGRNSSSRASSRSPDPDDDDNRQARSGGGRNAQKANQDRVDRARDNLSTAKQNLRSLQSQPNKTPQVKEQIAKAQREVNRAQIRLRESENHSMRNKEPR